jgi:hypothetical protein
LQQLEHRSWSLCTVGLLAAEMNEGVALGDDVSQGEDGVCLVCLGTSPSPIQSGCACRGAAGLAHLRCRIEATEAKEQYQVVVDLPDVQATIHRRDEERAGECVVVRERVLFIGTQFSILYTSMYSPA